MEGAETIELKGYPTAKTFEGVDVLVNALGGLYDTTKSASVKAVIEAGVKVYFPSEFGVRVPALPGKKSYSSSRRLISP